jgi:hypothetical protein
MFARGALALPAVFRVEAAVELGRVIVATTSAPRNHQDARRIGPG